LSQIRKKAEAAQEQLELENNLLQLEQKALQLQMNPHFIFNALNTAQSLFMSDDQAAARSLISKFAKLMRAILLHSRETSIPLKEEIDLLENYLAIEQFSRPNKFVYKIKVADELDVDELMIPPMMIQPFVENAIKHGINHLKGEGKIEIEFLKKGNKLECSIADNGIGRTASAELNAQKTKNHKSTALLVTKERLEILNENKNYYKSLEINDLVGGDGSSAGTKVTIRMPLEEW
jgi:sensor histidine kinase YesM